MPKPTDVSGVRRLLGMVNYVARFIPNLADVTEPLRILLKKEVQWHWHTKQEESFEEIKKLLTGCECLAFYDVNKPVQITVDASKSGVGTCRMQDERPVAYASRSMNDAQRIMR